MMMVPFLIASSSVLKMAAMVLIFPRMYGTKWKALSQAVCSLNVRKDRLCRMRWKEYWIVKATLGSWLRVKDSWLMVIGYLGLKVNGS